MATKKREKNPIKFYAVAGLILIKFISILPNPYLFYFFYLGWFI